MTLKVDSGADVTVISDNESLPIIGQVNLSSVHASDAYKKFPILFKELGKTDWEFTTSISFSKKLAVV